MFNSQIQFWEYVMTAITWLNYSNAMEFTERINRIVYLLNIHREFDLDLNEIIKMSTELMKIYNSLFCITINTLLSFIWVFRVLYAIFFSKGPTPKSDSGSALVVHHDTKFYPTTLVKYSSIWLGARLSFLPRIFLLK